MSKYCLKRFGNKEQKEEWCHRLSTMELFSSYCLTEPNSGSDAAAMVTSATEDEDDFVINGSKIFISGGSVSDLYVVMCKTGENEISTILVPKDAKGISFGKKEEKVSFVLFRWGGRASQPQW